MDHYDKVIIIGSNGEWLRHCYGKAVKQAKVKLFEDSFPISHWKLQQRCRRFYHLHRKYRFVWYPLFWLSMKMWERKKTLIVVHDWSRLATDERFVRYMRKKARVVYMFTNINPITGATTYGIIDQLPQMFDAIFTYDRIEANKMGYRHLPLPYEPAVATDDLDKEPLSDLFFVGKAKDRIDTIHAIYERATAQGLVCDFHITEAKAEDMIHKGISYNYRLPYDEVMRRTMRTRCLVEPIQGQSIGFTLRVPEAVLFNKKLLSTNLALRDEPFYDPSKITFWDDNVDLKSFIESGSIQYSDRERELFSVDTFLHTIAREAST